MPRKAAASISGPTSVPVLERIADRQLLIDAFTAARRALADRHRARSAAAASCSAGRRCRPPRTRSRARARSRSADGATIIALLPPSSSMRSTEARGDRGPTARPIRVEPVAETSGTCACRRPAPRRLSRPPITTCDSAAGRVAESRQRALEDLLRRERGERRLLRRLPDHAVAAHQRERRVPGPHRDRKVERGDHADRPQRMPRLASSGGPAARDAIVRP